MTFIEQLRQAQQQNQSLLCVGLDPEPARLPAGVARDAQGIYDFCVAIAEATHDLACAFKRKTSWSA